MNNSYFDSICLELINYFGDRSLVIDALNNVKVVNCNNIYNYLKNNNLLDYISSNSFDKLKIIGGIYLSFPTLDYEDNKYTLDSIDRYLIVSNFNINNKHSLGALIHEMCHTIKSYKDEFVVNNHSIINNSGVLKKECMIDDDFNITNFKVSNIALEEALTVYLEEEIMKSIGYKDYKSLSYLGVNNIIRDLINSFNLNLEFKKAQINHDLSEIKDILKDNYDLIINLINEVYKMDLDLVINKDKEDKEKKISYMLNYIDSNYYPIKEKIVNDLNNRGR